MKQYFFGVGEYYTSLYAIGTALMGLSMVIAGALSGFMQAILGYQNFFIWIFISQLAITIFSYTLLKKGIFNSENIAHRTRK